MTTIAIRKHEPAPEPRHPDVRLRDEIKEGLAFVFDHPILRKVVGCTSTSNFFSAATFAVLTVFLVRTLDSPTWVIGVVFSVGSLGGLIGGLLAGRIGKAVGTARIIWLSQVVAGPFGLLAVIAFPRLGPDARRNQHPRRRASAASSTTPRRCRTGRASARPRCSGG